MEAVGGLIYFLFAFLRCYSFLCVVELFRCYVGQITLLVIGCALAALALSNADAGRLSVCAQMGVFQVLVSGLWQIAFGALIGFAVFIAAEAVLIGARIGDSVRGAQFAEQINPLLEMRVSCAENAIGLAILALVFSSGLYQVPLSLIFASLDEAGFCPDAAARVFFSSLGLLSAPRLSADAIRFGVCAAAPVIVFCLVFDIGSALISRVLPRLNSSFEFLPIKMLLGFIVLVLAFIYSGQELDGILRQSLSELLLRQGETRF